MFLKKTTLVFIFSIVLIACNDTSKTQEAIAPESVVPTFQNKGHELVYAMSKKTGSYQDLLALKDVVYKYTYRTPDQKEDVSIESYIFDGELSYGNYVKHQRTLPQLAGSMEQGFDGSDFWLKSNNTIIQDTTAQESVAFTRKTNFYWFAMMQKLLDPNLNYQYKGEKKVGDVVYDIVKVTFDTSPEVASDIYQLYINKETKLVDQFLFTVVSKNVTDPVLMRVTYQEVSGVMLTNYRKYTKSDWDASVLENSWVEEISENIQFDQGLKPTLFRP